MNFFVLCTFDLKNATLQNYQTAYADLANIGLKKVNVGSNGSSVVVPTTTVTGEFTGNNAGDVSNYILSKVKSAFTARRFSSEIFVTVGTNWAWSAATT